MKDKESQSFKIRLDEDEVEPGVKDGIGDLRLKKMNQRLTLFAILIPCLIGILLIFAYIDLKNRMTNIHTTGSTEVQNLSHDIESRLSSLSMETIQLKELINTETVSLKEKNILFSIDLDKNKTALKKINSGKADKSALRQSISAVEKKIHPAKKDLEEIKSRLTRLDQKTAGEISKLKDHIRQMSKEIKNSELNIAFLSDNQIDQRQIDLALAIQEKRLHQQSIKERKSIENQLSALKSKTDALEKKLARLTRPQPAQKPEKKAGPQDSPGIVEQDIKE